VVSTLLLHAGGPPLDASELSQLGVCSLLDGGNDRGGGVEDDVKDDPGDFEVGAGGTISASDKLFSVGAHPLLEQGEDGSKVLVDVVLATLFSWCLASEDRLQVLSLNALHVINVVHDGVDVPGDDGVFAVVSEADGERAQDGVCLTSCETVFNPDGRLAQGELSSGLPLAELLERETIILVVEVGVG